jgi:hypothetical protein
MLIQGHTTGFSSVSLAGILFRRRSRLSNREALAEAEMLAPVLVTAE